ncbi:MAG: 5'-3' exonuclease [Puniceicoccaceae bacterium]|nr:MAG: 5'-3' exonuclease [Puniceicoccaceae bacterium]
MAKWLLLDGFNLAFRAFYAVPDLTRSDGFPTNALYGWIRSLWKLEDTEQPEGRVVFFDLGGAAAREALLPSYKAQRAETPEALERQIPLIKELTAAMGYGVVEESGVESDDLLAACAVRLAKAGHTVRIVSADKDFAQVVDERIQLLLPPPTANPRLGWRSLDRTGVEEKFGVPPDQIVDYLALVGDTSDNIPGLPGVGPKTAAKWLRAHGSLRALLEDPDAVKPPRFAPLLSEHRENLLLNVRLITLDLGVGTPPVETPPPDPGQVFRILGELEMKTHLEEARRRYAQGTLGL